MGVTSLLLMTACSNENRVEIIEEQQDLFSEDFQENIVKNDLLNKFKVKYDNVLKHLNSNKISYEENIVKESFIETPLYQITLKLDDDRNSLININFQDDRTILGLGSKKEKSFLRNTTLFIDGYKLLNVPTDDFETILQVEEESNNLKKDLQLSSKIINENIFSSLMNASIKNNEEHLPNEDLQQTEDILNEIEQTIDIISDLNSVLILKSIPNVKENKYLIDEIESLSNEVQSKAKFYNIKMEEIESNFYLIQSKNLNYTLKIEVHEDHITYQFSY